MGEYKDRERSIQWYRQQEQICAWKHWVHQWHVGGLVVEALRRARWNHARQMKARAVEAWRTSTANVMAQGRMLRRAVTKMLHKVCPCDCLSLLTSSPVPQTYSLLPVLYGYSLLPVFAGTK